MNLLSMFFASVAGVGLIEASIEHYTEVTPIDQPDAITITDKSGVRYQPSLTVNGGCLPYPAVDASGATSNGLPIAYGDLPNSGCGIQERGAQVYGRAIWHRDRWAIMYTWYFPKNQPKDDGVGHVHDWANIVVWINNPDAPVQTILGVAASWKGNKYKKHIPLPPEFLDGNTTKVEYRHDPDNDDYFDVGLTKKSGYFYQLIIWDLMPDTARNALNTTDFGPNATVPFNDIYFEANLDLAWLD